LATAFDRFVAPHIGDAFGHVVAAVAGLAPLEVEPFLVLKGAIARVRTIVNAGWLVVAIPRMDFFAASVHLRDVALAVAADEVNRRTRAVTRYQITAVARIFVRGHHQAGHIQTFPAVAVKNRLIHRHDSCANENINQLIEGIENTRC
jgi:hypothetical protein